MYLTERVHVAPHTSELARYSLADIQIQNIQRLTG